MTESKAVESYRAFESLRNRFGGAKESHAHQRRENKAAKPKRRFDPRANAPPLVPLVEESDQLQKESFADSFTATRLVSEVVVAWQLSVLR